MQTYQRQACIQLAGRASTAGCHDALRRDAVACRAQYVADGAGFVGWGNERVRNIELLLAQLARKRQTNVVIDADACFLGLGCLAVHRQACTDSFFVASMPTRVMMEPSKPWMRA